MTVPSGFGIDSFVPPPPAGTAGLQQTGSGDSAVVPKVTWTGGSDPDRRGLAVSVPRPAGLGEDVHVQVQQTYSDGSIVNWSGSGVLGGPAPTIEVKDSLGGGGDARC